MISKRVFGYPGFIPRIGTPVLTLVLVLTSGAHCSNAQVNSDGPFSRELLELVVEYETYLQSARPIVDFVPSDSSVRVDSGFVLVDATALQSGDDLLTELVGHGLKSGSAFGLMVSGWFPIAVIAAAPEMTHLKFMRAAQAATGVGRG